MDVSFGKRGVKLFSTMRLVSRAGVVISCLSSFMRTILTRAKYSDTVSLAPISRVSNSRFALSYASSSFSSAIVVSVRHASEGEPISVTISIISGSFSNAFVRVVRLATTCVPTRGCTISRVLRAGFRKFLSTRLIQALNHTLLH